MNKLRGVEAARGIAALLVVLVHVSSMLSDYKYLGEMPLRGLFKFGHAGVDFFFVLSGFIIYYIHSGELGKPRFFIKYWRKRFVRIFPIYWIILALYGLILFFSPTKQMLERMPSVAVSAILLLPNVNGPVLGVAWTLSHELLFYLLFGTLFIHLNAGCLVLAAWASLLVLNIFISIFDGYIFGGVVFRILNIGFFFGIFVAHSLMSKPAFFPRIFFWAGILLFFFAGMYESWGPEVPNEWPPLHLTYAASAAAALYGLVAMEKSGVLRVPEPLVVLGKASYSIYLLHTIVIMILQQIFLYFKQFIFLPDTLVFFVFVVIAVTIPISFSRRIEQPLLRYLQPKGTRRT